MQRTKSGVNPNKVNAGTITIAQGFESSIGEIENVNKITLQPNSKLTIKSNNTVFENNTINEIHEYTANNDEYVLSGVVPAETA